MSQLSEAFDRIATLYPEAIKPGISFEQIEEYLKDFPLKLPEELYELYQLSDGLDHSNPATLIFGFGELFSLSQAMKLYNNLQEHPDYYSGWFPITDVEDWIYVIRGDLEQCETAPIIRFDHGDLIYGNDWEPQVLYPNLTEMILDAVYMIENPYG